MDGVFPGRSQGFCYQRRPVNDCSPGRGGIAPNKGAELSMAKWIVAEKQGRAEHGHAAICTNVTGITKGRIVQSKRAS